MMTSTQIPSVELPSVPLAWQRRIGFFLILPASIGFLMGWNLAGAGALLPKGWSVAVWVATWCLSWWVSEAALRGARYVLRPWTARLAPALAAAGLANLVLSILYCRILLETGATLAGVTLPRVSPDYSRNLLDPAYLWVLLQAAGPGLVMWVWLRYGYELLLRGPAAARPSSEPAPAAAPHGEPLAAQKLLSLVTRQGPASLEGVIALQAEDHYVRLHWPDRNILVLMRFSEAVAAFAPAAGLRVHRSFWVRRTAVRSLKPNGAGARLTLSNGLEAPVSQAYKALVEHALADKFKGAQP